MRTRRFRASLVAALLLSAATLSACQLGNAAAEQDAKELHPVSGLHFSIQMPGTVREVTQPVTVGNRTLNVHEWRAESGLAGVVVSETTYPRRSSVDLDGAVRASSRAFSGQLLEKKTIRYRGHRARDARFTSVLKGHDYTTFCRFVADGHRLISIVQVVYGKALTTPPDSYAKVLASLRIT